MAKTKAELKKIACEAIDKHAEDIIGIGDSIFMEPELGFKEFKTAEKVKKVFDELGYAYTDQQAITGIIAPRKGKESKLKVAVMGELDAVVAPEHPYADKATGAAHSCGHFAQIASVIGVSYALKDTGIMEELSGDVILMAVPAEEYVEIEYRNELRKQGKLHFLGGKQEFIRLGLMDDIDIMVMQHSTVTEGGSVTSDIKVNCGNNSNGMVGKLINYKGKEAHAGGAPHLGINALNAAEIGLMAVHAQRETFQDKDHIRVHPIINKGGDLVNVVPADVRIETYVRGASVEGILDASKKVTRAFEAGGYAVGAQTEIIDLPGYLPMLEHDGLMDLMYDNLCQLVGKEKVARHVPASTGCTDAGDVAHLMPTMHAYIGGISGTGHSKDYVVADKNLVYIVASKCLIMTVIDLLAEGAETGLEIKKSFVPKMTKAEYLDTWGNLK